MITWSGSTKCRTIILREAKIKGKIINVKYPLNTHPSTWLDLKKVK
jgi:hypothetical protein